jgi:hypothetical protein
MFIYFPRILRMRRKNGEYAERNGLLLTMPDEVKGTLFQENQLPFAEKYKFYELSQTCLFLSNIPFKRYITLFVQPRDIYVADRYCIYVYKIYIYIKM